MHTRSFVAMSALLLAVLGCGDETTAPTEARPGTPQPSVTTATALAFWQVDGGDWYTCGVTTDYRAYCWGNNWRGTLGDGTSTYRFQPVAVLGGLHFQQISAGSIHSCGITPDYRAYCWGAN